MDIALFNHEALTISAHAADRVAPHIKPLIADNQTMFDVHCHLFNEKAVPKMLFNMKMPWHIQMAATIINKLHRINKRSSTDWASRHAYFCEICIKQTSEIADKLLSY